MNIRFRTKDGVTEVKECHDVEEPVSVVMRPMWSYSPKTDSKPWRFMEYRRYEFRGERREGIPTVHEA